MILLTLYFTQEETRVLRILIVITMQIQNVILTVVFAKHR